MKIIVLALVSMLVATPILMLSVEAQSTFPWEASVSSTGEPVSSPALESGKRYLIIAEEMWWYDYPNNLAADAQYYTTDDSNSWTWGNNSPAPDGHSFLQINSEE